MVRSSVITSIHKYVSKNAALKFVGIASIALFATACTTTGNMERNAGAGAAAGALAGAVIGNNTGDGDAEKGAVAGAIIGGAAGAYKGYRDDQQYHGGTTRRDGQYRNRQGQTYEKARPVTQHSSQNNGQYQQQSNPAAGQRLIYDEIAGRYYFVDQQSGRTYWQNGALRSY